MGDISVYEIPIDWIILPPLAAKPGSLFTVVAQFEFAALPQIYEAYIPDRLGSVSERFPGKLRHAKPGFNNNVNPAIYVYFNICTQQKGKLELKFRLTWRWGRHLCGGLETFDINISQDIAEIEYRTDDQDLLALLDPDHYDPTPIELMNERA
ncbi:hypothetical protein FHL15_005652 [Xylaria flabelliformis]|uniref:Uncharacterized protein n=1 Tax=Xylaria flabelliformis TaxID=2512241 RepID=A0A553HZK1_9PEZI|nr:hypothetical protein FHL15_005652 [Xylaria flabelliformis]